MSPYFVSPLCPCLLHVLYDTDYSPVGYLRQENSICEFRQETQGEFMKFLVIPLFYSFRCLLLSVVDCRYQCVNGCLDDIGVWHFVQKNQDFAVYFNSVLHSIYTLFLCSLVSKSITLKSVCTPVTVSTYFSLPYFSVYLSNSSCTNSSSGWV